MIGNLQLVKQPTGKALSRWWSFYKDESERMTCLDCGKEGPAAYTQPQHPFFVKNEPGVEMVIRSDGYPEARKDGRIVAWCTDCISRRNQESRKRRKEALAAMPRCEVPSCKRRATYRAGRGENKIGLCGGHLKKAQLAHHHVMAGAGGMALFLPAPDYSREELLKMAAGGAA